MDARSQAAWKDNRLYLGSRASGFSIVRDENYPDMWRIQSPDGRLSDMVNKTRAKDGAMSLLDRNLRCGDSPTEARTARKAA